MDSPDFPGLGIPFIGPAVSRTSGRPDGPPVLGVLHATANTATPTQEATYAARANPASAHFYVGDASPALVQALRLADCSWNAGGRFGNRRGVAIEVCGLVSQSRSTWLADDRDIRAAGLAVALTAARTGIQMRWLTDQQLLDLYRNPSISRSGWCTHYQYNRVVPDSGSDHNDPGPGFPYDELMAAAHAAAGTGGAGMAGMTDEHWALVTAVTGGAVPDGDMANVAPAWARGFRKYTIDQAIAATVAVGEKIDDLAGRIGQPAPVNVTMSSSDKQAIGAAAAAAAGGQITALTQQVATLAEAVARIEAHLHATGKALSD